MPIAVPDSCNHVVFSKVKTISRICRNRFEGKSEGRDSSLDVIKSLMAWTPMFVFILVYMDFVSTENKKAFSGISIVLRSWMTVNEFLM